jgi:tetratricopeptide (TPR) repeat protein
MITSKEVFEKRKAGQTYEAYQMGQELVRNNPNDPWNIKALAYCLVDLIKDASNRNDDNSLRSFVSELNGLDIDQNDEILVRSVNHAKGLGNPQTKIIADAKALSKQGRHHDAVNAYRTALRSFPSDISVYEGLGWELYRVGKDIFGTEKIDVFKAKQLLNEYIKLKNERPSRLHSLFLRYADKLIGSEGFNLVAFLRFWDLNNLTHEDYEPYQADNGKSYPSVAEKVIQHAAKDGLSRHIEDDMKYILPYVDNAISTFPENFWLTYYKAKLLLGVGQNREAYEFSLSVAKAKLNEYWAWDLLAETLIGTDTEKAFGCYSKALTCRSDEKFLANVRMKFADLLIQKSLYREAKYEIDQAIKSREQEGWKLTETQLQYKNAEWYQNTTATKDNRDFYKQHTAIAEALLFDSLPWLNASLGNTFTTTKNPDKPKRKIFLSMANQSTPTEISVSERRYPFKSMKLGSGLKVKGEYDVERRFQIYLIEPRSEAQQWDVFSEYIGIIDHINHDKKLAHFIVDRKIDGVIHFENFSMNFNVADIVALKFASHTHDRGTQYTVLACQPTNKEISIFTAKRFKSMVRISNGLGFTMDDIFIDRPFIDHCKINDGDYVEGLAVLNFNRKKGIWGWKMVKIAEQSLKRI